MPLSPAAENELRQMLRAFRAAYSGAVVPTGEGKALEAWVLMKLAFSIRTGLPAWSVTLRRGDGTLLPPGASFDLPSTGTRIPPNNPNAPGYILLEHTTARDRRFELRTNIRWKGRSGARHEIDVSVLPASISEALRNSGGGYPHGLPILSVECKDKGTMGTLDETRQALARMYDLVLVTQPNSGWSCRIFEGNTDQRWGRKSSRYTAFFKKGTFAVVRAGGVQSGASTLADHYSIRLCPDIYNDRNSITRLLASFQRTLAEISGY